MGWVEANRRTELCHIAVVGQNGRAGRCVVARSAGAKLLVKPFNTLGRKAVISVRKRW